MQVEYAASAVLVVEHKSMDYVQSSPNAIQMVPRTSKQSTAQPGGSEQKEENPNAQQEPIRKTVQKDFLLGGSANFAVTLNKQSFARGEQIDVTIDIDNKSSYCIKSVDIAFNEWSLSQMGKGESHTRGNYPLLFCYHANLLYLLSQGKQSSPVEIQKGSQQIKLPFVLQWEDDADAKPQQPQQGKAQVKRGYYMQVSFGIPYAVDPALLIPIRLLHPYPH